MNSFDQFFEETADLSDEQLAKKMDSFLHIYTEEIQRDGKDTYHCHRYEPTPYRVLQILSEQLPLRKEDTLLDYGSGLGRLIFFTNHIFGCGAIGVEMSDELYKQSMDNLKKYRGVYKDRLEFVHEKAEDFDVPENVNCIYFFNPFSTAIFRSVMTKIEKSYEKNPREISLVLYYPEDNTIFYIERHTSFQLKCEIPVLEMVGKDRRERFVVYNIK